MWMLTVFLATTWSILRNENQNLILWFCLQGQPSKKWQNGSCSHEKGSIHPIVIVWWLTTMVHGFWAGNGDLQTLSILFLSLDWFKQNIESGLRSQMWSHNNRFHDYKRDTLKPHYQNATKSVKETNSHHHVQSQFSSDSEASIPI